MERNDALYQAYCAILREELVPATGCTEPIALAYCAAKARHVLGRMPDRVRAQVSGNIIKNVKSVTVPNTGGQKGIRAAVAAGIVAGDEGAGLEALGNVTPDQIRDIERFAAETPIEVVPLESGVLLDMIVTVWSGEHEASVRISHSHTHIVSIRVDGNTLFSEDGSVESTEATVDYALLTVEDICAFADCLDPREGKFYVLKQIHHEPCEYYSFGNKIEAEQNDYNRLLQTGIRIPRMLDIDVANERILKEYIDYECNNYMDEWNFENWGIKYWSKTTEFIDYMEQH